MIICKLSDPPDDHLQEARSSGWVRVTRVMGQKEEKKEKEKKEKFLHTDGPTKGSTRGPCGPKKIHLYFTKH